MNKHADPIEAALRAPEAPLADDDFSATVLARLAPKRTRHAVARRWTLAGAASLGSVVTLALASPLENVLASLLPWSLPPLAFSAVAVLAIVVVPAAYFLYTEHADR